MRHQSLLEYANFRYFKVAVVVVALAIGAYMWDKEPGGPNGGTWVGYGLGTFGALLILWLLWFGIRKRRYSGTVPLIGWLSAHVYLGVTLIVVATLHAAFQVGLNVHTLAYLLMLFVIFSGFYGVYVYLQVPRQLTDNLGDETRSSLLLKISVAAAALGDRPALRNGGRGAQARSARQDAARRGCEHQSAALHAAAAQAGISRGGAPRRRVQGPPRPLAVPARSRVDRAAGGADRARGQRLFLLVTGAP